VKQILEQAAIRTTASPNPVGGLSGYLCREGHLFFVRSCDLEPWAEQAEFP